MCREMAHYSQSCTRIHNQKTAASALQETHTNLPGSCQYLPHSPPRIKSFHGDKSVFSSQHPISPDIENLDLTAGLPAVTQNQRRTLCLPSTKLLRAPPLIVKRFAVALQSIRGTRPLCLSSLGDGDSRRKERTATIPKKNNGNMSYKDSRVTMTSLVYPKALHTFQHKATQDTAKNGGSVETINPATEGCTAMKDRRHKAQAKQKTLDPPTLCSA